jgi:hypothetical protein
VAYGEKCESFRKRTKAAAAVRFAAIVQSAALAIEAAQLPVLV